MPGRIRISVLVVFLVIFLGIGMSVPAIRNLREAANRMSCRGHLKWIGLAIHNYASVDAKNLPTAAWPHDDLPPEKRLSWIAAILPYVEQDRLAKQLQKELGWEAPEHRQLLEVGFQPFHCPSSMSREEARKDNRTHYISIAGVGEDAASLAKDDPNRGVFNYEFTTRFDDMKDGTSVTLLLAETSLDNGPWLAAGRPTVRGYVTDVEPLVGVRGQFGGFHEPHWFPGSSPGGVNVCFADSSVRTLLPTISPRVFRALCTIAGGEDKDHELD